jgi:hypothetical protein
MIRHATAADVPQLNEQTIERKGHESAEEEAAEAALASKGLLQDGWQAK